MTEREFQLTDLQNFFVDQCVRAIESRMERLSESYRPDIHVPRVARLDALKIPRVGNVVGLFGSRGTGKTTTVVETIRALTSQSPPRRCNVDDRYVTRIERGGKPWLLLRLPLDLSQMPADTPQGLSVLEWVHRLLAKAESRHEDDGREERFEKVRKAFVLRTKDASEVARAVSLGLDDFGRRCSQRLDFQMNLPDLVCEWLESELSRDRVRAAGVIVVVDDVDLCRAEGQESLVWSLLDELHQDQLLVMLVGDYARLEKNVTERLVQTHDNRTASELWEKAIPETHRVTLRPWTPSECDEFSKVFGSSQRFSKRVDGLGFKALARLMPYILPEAPRGLSTVHEVLQELEMDPQPSIQDLVTKVVRISTDGAFANAALSGTARWLERALWDRLDEKGGALDQSTPWRRMTYDASVGTLADDEAPIRELVPDNPEDLGLTGLSESERSRWTETFIDLELAKATTDAMPPRRLLNAHATLRWISKQLTPTVEISGNRAAKYLERASPTKDTELMWMRWVPSEQRSGEERKVHYQLGLRPLLSYLGGRRNRLDFAVAEELMVGGQEDRRPTPTDPVMPRSVRDIIRFMSAMNLVDWRALANSGYLRSPGAMARLTAGLVWISYWRALERLGENPQIPHPWTHGFSNWDDDQINREFRELLACEPLKQADLRNASRCEPLYDAWAEFHQADCFRLLDNVGSR